MKHSEQNQDSIGSFLQFFPVPYGKQIIKTEQVKNFQIKLLLEL
jgi:hypothetical protein